MNTETGWYDYVHPVFRIICFVIYSLSIAFGSFAQLGIATLSVIVLYATTARCNIAGFLQMLRRMRWFLLSILFIYAWLTPGMPLFGGAFDSFWQPSVEGLWQGGQRLLALILIVAAVHWLLQVTSQQQLVAALYWLAAPLQLVGLPHERLAVRLALVMGRVSDVQQQVAAQIRQADVDKRDIKSYAAVAADLIVGIVRQADLSRCDVLEIDIADKPPVWQWCWPLLLLSVMLLVTKLVK
jgi:energy-coupling factor transport system permease protein